MIPATCWVQLKYPSVLSSYLPTYLLTVAHSKALGALHHLPTTYLPIYLEASISDTSHMLGTVEVSLRPIILPTYLPTYSSSFESSGRTPSPTYYLPTYLPGSEYQ